MTDVLYNNSDFSFTVKYFDSDQTTQIPASSVAYAKYSIFDQSNNCILDKELGMGIIVVGTDFEVQLLQGDLTKYGTLKHQFSVGDSASELEPPIFSNNVEVINVPRCP